MASLSTCHLGLWLGWQILLNIKKINEHCSNVQFNVQMIVNVKEIQDIIHAMSIGKAPGYDSVINEHFKYANEKLHVLMSLLYSSMLIHGFFYRML